MKQIIYKFAKATLAVVLTLCAMAASAQKIGKTYIGGREFTTEDGWILINNSDDLDCIAEESVLLNYRGKKFKQTADINYKGRSFSTNPRDGYFQGVYDGGNHILTGNRVWHKVGKAIFRNLRIINPLGYTYGEVQIGKDHNYEIYKCYSGGFILEGEIGINNIIVINPSFQVTPPESNGYNIIEEGVDKGAIVGLFERLPNQEENEWNNEPSCFYYSPDNEVKGIGRYYPSDETDKTTRLHKLTLPAEVTANSDGIIFTYDGAHYCTSDAAVTLTVTATNYVKISVTGATATPTETSGQYELTMPANDVTVSLTNVELTFSDLGDLTYTGSEIIPKATVKDGNTTLTLGTDYEVSFSDNINVGTAKATITGKGSYYGTVEMTFTINAKALTASNVADIAAQTYTGSAIEPEITVKDGSKTLILGTDYEVSHTDNTNAGTAKVTITGKGNYSGTVEKTFTINAKALTASNVADIAAQTYTGSAIEPVTVKDGSKTLILGTDYEVSYSDNTNAGTAIAIITGKGNYSGTVVKTYTITPKVTESDALTLTEYGNRTTATIVGSSDYSLSIADDIDVDEVTYSRIFTADGGAYTIMLPFSFDASGVKGTFHTLGDITPLTETVWKAELSSAITEIQANTPYIFKPSEDIDKMLFENVTLKATTSPSLTFTNACENSNWKLHGVYSQKVWTDEDEKLYGFAAAAQGEISVGEFVHFVTGATLKATRCYLEYSEDGFSKSAVVLPEKIIVVFPENNNGEIITPVSEITPSNGTNVWSADKKIVIESKAGDQYRIIDLNGRTLRESRLTADREEVTLSRTAGIVIVKINGKTFKINY